MNGAPALEPTTLAHGGAGVVFGVPDGERAALPLVWLRLERPGGSPTPGARAAVVVHVAPPRPCDTLAVVHLGAGTGATTAEAAGAATAIVGPATVVVETDLEPPYVCDVTVRVAWGGA